MIVWLASYPRSGNTFFRVILNSIFNIQTYSMYDDKGDIGADETTSNVVGHKFLPKDFDLIKARESNNIYYIKTHELRENIIINNQDKVIYLVRDGRESILSYTKHLQNFYNKSNDKLDQVIYGDTPFGSWGEHVRGWNALENSLTIKFEELTDDPISKISVISEYLDILPVNKKIPTFKELNKINPKFFRSGKKDSWKNHFTDSEHISFWLHNFNEMNLIGYEDNKPDIFSKFIFNEYASLFLQEFNLFKKYTTNKSNSTIEKKDIIIKNKNTQISNTNTNLNNIRTILNKKDQLIKEKNEYINTLSSTILNKDEYINTLSSTINILNNKLSDLRMVLKKRDESIEFANKKEQKADKTIQQLEDKYTKLIHSISSNKLLKLFLDKRTKGLINE